MNEEKIINKIRDIKEIYQLEDFTKDNRKFIDPYRINPNDSIYIPGAADIVNQYFERFFEDVKTNNEKDVYKIGEYLHEINDNRLGYTNYESEPKGKGFCVKDLLNIYKSAKENENLIDKMPDILVFARNIGPDKISDLTTNIIYEYLYYFTEYIIKKYSLTFERKNIKRYIWNMRENRWINREFRVPLLYGKPILFLPDEIVCSSLIFSYKTTYTHCFMNTFKANPKILNIVRYRKDGGIEADCGKIKELYPQNRDTVEKFGKEYRSNYEAYRDDLLKDFWRGKYIGK